MFVLPTLHHSVSRLEAHAEQQPMQISAAWNSREGVPSGRNQDVELEIRPLFTPQIYPRFPILLLNRE
jgi:hypothetical protein